MLIWTRQGIIYISAPITFALILSYPQLKRWACPIGLIIMCLSISLSSFARNTTDLILSQGIGYAVGAGLAYAPTIVLMDEWFVRRKGFAYGVMWVSSGILIPLKNERGSRPHLQPDPDPFLTSHASSGGYRRQRCRPSHPDAVATQQLRPQDGPTNVVNHRLHRHRPVAVLHETTTSHRTDDTRTNIRPQLPPHAQVQHLSGL